MSAYTEKQAHIARLVEKTRDAYSYNNYGSVGWRSAVRALIDLGYTDREAEAILRSKWMRWSGDTSGKRYGRNNGQDLRRFLASPMCTPAAVRRLVHG